MEVTFSELYPWRDQVSTGIIRLYLHAIPEQQMETKRCYRPRPEGGETGTARNTTGARMLVLG